LQFRLVVLGFSQFLQPFFYLRGIWLVIYRGWERLFSLLQLLSSSVHHRRQEIGDVLGILE
jgi:hypothetical protein